MLIARRKEKDDKKTEERTKMNNIGIESELKTTMHGHNGEY